MGVPVVTLRGERWVGRMSESILSAVGLPELVAANEVEYVETAVQLAADLPGLAERRSGLAFAGRRLALLQRSWVHPAA